MPPAEKKSELLYPHDSRMAPGKAALAALQQVVAMFIGCITPALIYISVVGVEAQNQGYLVSMCLFSAGLGTFLQAKRIGPIGSGLLSVNGTSFAYLDLLLRAGQEGGLPLACGMTLAAVPLQFVLSFFLPALRRYFSPIIAGIVVLLIGLNLIPVAGHSIASIPDGSGPEAWTQNFILSAIVVVALIGTQVLGKPMLRICGPVIAIGIGFGLAAAFGMLSWPESNGGPWLVLPQPLHEGLAFKWDLLIPFMIIYFVSSIEAIGDLTATASLSGMKTDGIDFWHRLRGGILSDAITSTFAALINVFPTATFSQNNGVIQLTGVGSRQVGFYVAGILMITGLLPQTGLVFSMIPGPVLGGVTLVLFGLIAGAGLRMINDQHLGSKEVLVLAISLGMAFAIPSQKEFVENLPSLLQGIFSSPVATGGLTAVIMNIFYLRPQ
ncbi:uracil-xanthine permease family protein [Coraliomargarita parva]|uniref:uracil-xanthine permease family protein n=1 Tax=Coraliomargarita parva TaxID=3014050 RepID=UPI0022B40388|nr:solute carrier family 23 protein [Coraliomargarita parva]